VRESRESGGKKSGLFELRGDELNREGKPSRRQDFFVDLFEDLLSCQVGCQSLAKDPKEIGLFDVFF